LCPCNQDIDYVFEVISKHTTPLNAWLTETAWQRATSGGEAGWDHLIQKIGVGELVKPFRSRDIAWMLRHGMPRNFFAFVLWIKRRDKVCDADGRVTGMTVGRI
jgi:hypothetical protein